MASTPGTSKQRLGTATGCRPNRLSITIDYNLKPLIAGLPGLLMSHCDCLHMRRRFYNADVAL